VQVDGSVDLVDAVKKVLHRLLLALHIEQGLFRPLHTLDELLHALRLVLDHFRQDLSATPMVLSSRSA
jgi:hypothetical protein